jgi:hypothetical protein
MASRSAARVKLRLGHGDEVADLPQLQLGISHAAHALTCGYADRAADDAKEELP